MSVNGCVRRIDVGSKTVLRQAQEAVDGYVEQVRVPGMPGLVLLCNEDGLSKKLPVSVKRWRDE